MKISTRGEEAARTEERAVLLMWEYHTALWEAFGKDEVARRRAAYESFVGEVGHDPLGDS